MSPALPTDMSDEEIETRLGERYYGGSQAREEQLTDEITAVIRQFIKRRFDEGRRPALRDAHAQDTGCVKAINFSQKLQGAPSIPSPGNGAAKPIAVTAPQTSRR
jgi:hypothetical protein